MFSSTSEKNIRLRILIDTIILIIAFGVLTISYIDILTPFRRGYFCDDESIKYPFHPSTVSDVMLYSVSCSLGFIVILLSDFFSIEEETHPTDNQVFLFKWHIPHRCLRIYTSTYVFLFGTCITDILTNFIKYIIGRLRPNFLDICQSDFNCTVDPHRYVEDYTCLNQDVYNVNESRLSFPSGHASIVVFTMVFSMVYLHKRFMCLYCKLLKPVLQIFLFLWAAFTAMSRIQDNKHHVSDVIGGVVVGIAICCAMFCIQPNGFTQSSDSEADENNVSFNIGRERLSSFGKRPLGCATSATARGSII